MHDLELGSIQTIGEAAHEIHKGIPGARRGDSCGVLAGILVRAEQRHHVAINHLPYRSPLGWESSINSG